MLNMPRQSVPANADQQPKQAISSLNLKNQLVEVESKSLIQKAHELYNVQQRANS